MKATFLKTSIIIPQNMDGYLFPYTAVAAEKAIPLCHLSLSACQTSSPLLFVSQHYTGPPLKFDFRQNQADQVMCSTSVGLQGGITSLGSEGNEQLQITPREDVQPYTSEAKHVGLSLAGTSHKTAIQTNTAHRICA